MELKEHDFVRIVIKDPASKNVEFDGMHGAIISDYGRKQAASGKDQKFLVELEGGSEGTMLLVLLSGSELELVQRIGGRT